MVSFSNLFLYVYWCLEAHLQWCSSNCGCFGSFNFLHPPPGEPLESDQIQACFEMTMYLLFAFESHATWSTLTHRLCCRCLPLYSLHWYPYIWKFLPKKGLHLTSTGSHLALHEVYWQLLTRTAYSERSFNGFFQASSHGAFSSQGCRVVAPTCSGSFYCCSSTIINQQFLAGVRTATDIILKDFGCSSALTKVSSW